MNGEKTVDREAQGTDVLAVDDLRTVFHTQDGTIHAVNGVSFSLKPGELLGVVGESGSGKSVSMISAGTAMFEGRDLLSMDAKSLRRLRGADIGFIFQDPMTSLNPVFTVGYQLTEPLRIHRDMDKQTARKRAAELLSLVGIPDAERRLKDFPHQFSGGMRQRVMIAMALACDPKVLIADEPTTALDVTVQAQIIEIVKDLRDKMGTAIVWITHDLGVVAGIADSVAVMYGGQIVEYAAVADLYDDPRHPYTRALLQTLPASEGARTEKLVSIPGQAPKLDAPLSACPFAPRCASVHDRCWRENPPLFEVSARQKSRCWLEVETSPAVATEAVA